MARVTYVKKAQASKRPRRCRVCGKEIQVGDPYKWFASRIGRSSSRSNYCATCSIPRSHQTSSQQLATLYDAIDAAESAIDAAGDVDDLRSALEEAADQITEVAEMYRESASNIEEGFGHPTYISEELEGKADEVESFADEVRDVGYDLDAEMPDEDDIRLEEADLLIGHEPFVGTFDTDGDGDWPDNITFATAEEKAAWDEALAEAVKERMERESEEALEGAREKAREVLGNSPY